MDEESFDIIMRIYERLKEVAPQFGDRDKKYAVMSIIAEDLANGLSPEEIINNLGGVIERQHNITQAGKTSFTQSRFSGTHFKW